MCRPIIGRSLPGSKVIGRRSADRRPIVKFCDFLRYSVRFVFNVIASVGRQNDVYRPIKIQKSYRPTVFFNVIAALLSLHTFHHNEFLLKTEYLVLNFKSNLGTYGHNLLAYERNARGCKFAPGWEQICTRVQIVHMNTA